MNMENKKKRNKNIWKFWQQRRYILTFMLMLGQAIMFTIRVNMSIAIIPMTTNFTNDKNALKQGAAFEWNPKEQGIILSSFFYGSVVTQLPGGVLSKRFNGVKLYGAAICVASFLSVCTPLAQGFYSMVIVRTLQGLFLGVTFPTQMSIISQWAPSDERARMTMFSNSGLYFGTVVALQFSGIISRWMGWTSVFYIFGVIGLIWYAIWLKIIRESPEKDRRITAEEKQLILSSIGDRITRNIHIPWLQILTSVPVWALIVAHFTHCWLAYTLLAHMPRFFSQILNLQISEIGFVSSLPYLVNGCLSSFSGLLADKLLSKKVLTLVQTRKLFTCGSFLMQSILLFCITMFMGSWSNVVFLITTVCFSNLVMTGFWINFIDIAPQFSGILFAISNTIATVSGIISPTLTGILIQNENIEDWKKVFLISAAVCLFGSIFYGITASGVVQPWAKVQSQDETLDKINSRKNSSAITPDV